MPELGVTDGARKLYLEERQREILALLDSQSFVRINALVEHFGVSGATIRKDLRMLEQAGKLHRTHGGAIKPNPNAVEQEPEATATNALDEKKRIASEAAKLVSDNDVFYVGSGTTCQEFVLALKGKRRLTIITADLLIALDAEQTLPDSNIVLLGGTLRNGFHYSQGSEPLRQLRNYYVPTTYICCDGFSLERGFAMHRIEEANWIQAVHAVSERHIMLCDSTKVGVHALAQAAGIDEVDCLITGREVCDGAKEFLTQESFDMDIIYA